MSLESIITELSMKLVLIAGSPSQVVFAITMQDVIAEVARTLGEKALDLTTDDLLDIRTEVRIAIDHGLQISNYLQPGIESWAICKNL